MFGIGAALERKGGQAPRVMATTFTGRPFTAFNTPGRIISEYESPHTTMDDRVEHEAVVGARRESERQRHASPSMRSASEPRFSIASVSFQAPRLRRSTTFEMART